MSRERTQSVMRVAGGLASIFFPGVETFANHALMDVL